MRSQTIAIFRMATFWCMTAPLAHGLGQAWLPEGAVSMLATVQTNHPQLAAARAREAAEHGRADAHAGFCQPRVALATGGSRSPFLDLRHAAGVSLLSLEVDHGTLSASP